MKKLLFLLMMLPVVLIAQPGNPDANGVVSPGPPWVTGVSEGDGELKAQFGYLSTRIDSLPGPVFDVTIYGAVADGQASSATINRQAFQSAVDWCEMAGGGVVFVPPASKRYHLDSTIRIKESGVLIKGFTHETTQLWFENQNDYRTGFEFLGDETIINSGIEDLYIWLEEDTIVGAKFIHTQNSGVRGCRIRNTSGSADSTVAVSFRGQSIANWSGLNYLVFSKIQDVLIGADIDSVSNNNRIAFNDLTGNVSKHPGSTGVRIRPTAGASGQCDTQVLMANDFEGWEVAVKTEATGGKFSDNRFEGVDTAYHQSGSNTANYISGSSYASVSVEEHTDYADYVYYGLRLDPGKGLKIGSSNGTTGASLSLYSYSDVGSNMKFYNSAASSSTLLEFNTYTSASHTNVFGETLSLVEGIISSNFPLKIGTSAYQHLELYSNNAVRLIIPRFGIEPYVDNAAAITGGLSVNQVYRKPDGTLMVVY